MNSFARWIARSPRCRLAASIVGTMVVGVVSSIYATQIAPDGSIKWTAITTASTFWPLVLACAIWFLFNLALLRQDEEAVRFADDRLCLAFVRQSKLQAYAEMLKKDPSQLQAVDVATLLQELRVRSR